MWIFIRPAQCLQPRRAWAWRRIHRDLERLVALHDASAIAAVIVEPVACSMGIPPKGYLQRFAAICAKSSKWC